jgi:hypothetical protein
MRNLLVVVYNSSIEELYAIAIGKHDIHRQLVIYMQKILGICKKFDGWRSGVCKYFNIKDVRLTQKLRNPN